ELANPDSRYYVVALRQAPPEPDRDVLGYAGLAAYSGEAHVLTLGVAPAEQRRGLGAALLRDLLAAAERAGAHQVFLDVRADNLVAQRLYARHGFVAIGLRRRYYQPSGTDAITMVRGAAAGADVRPGRA